VQPVVVVASSKSSEQKPDETAEPVRASNAPPKADVYERILAQLLEFGVTLSKAQDLLRVYPLEQIDFQVECEAKRRPAENSAGRLIKAIEENWPAPRTVQVKQAADRAVQRTASDIERLSEMRRQVETTREAADEFISTMEEAEREELEAEAREMLAQDGMRDPRLSVVEATMRELVLARLREPAPAA
jgi:DNA repair exonuclease SbcCD nuclease subunit